jgi:hypothetical protein
VIIAILLAVLAMFDALLAGFRGAAGRDGLIDKRAYFRAAIKRAALHAAVLIAINIVVAAVIVMVAPGTWVELVRAGTICVWIFGGFASLTLVAIALWFAPDPEVQLLATIIVLGPLTLARPIVIAGGLAIAANATGNVGVWIVAAVAAVTMLSFESVVGRTHLRHWRSLVTDDVRT